MNNNTNNTMNNNNNNNNNENEVNIKTNMYLSVPELYKKFKETKIEIVNVKVDDKPSPFFMGVGKTPESEQEALSLAVVGSSNSYEAMKKMAIIANLTAKGISPDEEYENKFISYKNKTLYDMFGKAIINLEDIKCVLPDEAIKALLIERYKNQENKTFEEFEEEDY